MWEYNAGVLKVVDGDTLDLEVDLGFRTFQRVRVRLYGIDTPETYGVKKESEEYIAGIAAKGFVERWLANLIASTNGTEWQPAPVTIRSHDGKPIGAGKYGRWLVEVYPRDGGDSLNEELVENGHAERVVY
jgi:micrococcal nuclease